jgi:hypothetical protein
MAGALAVSSVGLTSAWWVDARWVDDWFVDDGSGAPRSALDRCSPARLGVPVLGDAMRAMSNR